MKLCNKEKVLDQVGPATERERVAFPPKGDTNRVDVPLERRVESSFAEAYCGVTKTPACGVSSV